MDAWIAGAIFLVTYVLIASERVDRTLAALLGGLLLIALGVLDQAEAFAAVDLSVILLLAGMMVLANALGRTGFFGWLAIRSVRIARGEPMRLLLLLSVLTAVLSAFLDNVTTVLLMVPVTLSVARRLGVSPAPYLITAVLASNIGGTATLIGDPPNLLIGSAAGLGFGDFLVNLAPVTALILVAFLVTIRLMFRSHLQVPDERREAAVEASEPAMIPDRGRLLRTLAVVGLTILGFLLHGVLGVEAATVALLGATVLLLLDRADPHEALARVEWSTLFFFVGLFILVEGVVSTGIVASIADAVARLTGGNEGAAVMTLLWFSAGASAVVDNIPYTATAIPVVQHLVDGGLPADAVWWALALGACLGGNLTIVGASANVVVADLGAREGHPLRFGEFLRYGSVVVVESLVIASVYLWVRYLL